MAGEAELAGDLDAFVARVRRAANAMPVSMTCFSTPSRPQRKSRCHQERRNSPSVIDCRPTSSCFLMTRSISRSSTAFSASARDLALGALRARLLQRRGPQQAADMIGAERRLGSLHVLFFTQPHTSSATHDHRAASPIARPRPAYCLPRSRRSRIAATGRAGRVDEFRRLVDAALELVLGFRACRSSMVTRPSTTGLALRHEAQRLEAAGALGVVFHEIAVHVDRVEQHLGDRLVAARGDEGRAEIAAAQMHGDGHVGGDVGDRRVDHAGIDRPAASPDPRRGRAPARAASDRTDR